ncbi:MAG: TIGR04283 family arsenosugar biosynthesis glycosyltransferase [Nitrosomonas sp.]|nr:TIGR04283 family arsenosugar biosynthesis glycosyltransferase [Nitrosomonas sp.]
MYSCSIIIPCYRDETKLTHLLDQLRKLPLAPLEIIVVDGASSSDCHEICRKNQALWLPSEPCRGLQLRAGAAIAQGEILWFLHADTRLSPNPLSAIINAIEHGAAGGYFRFCFDAPRAWPAVLLEPAIALRCRIGVPYGDQGLFVLSQIYIKAGGHAPWPLFEEVDLVNGVRRLGRFYPLREPIFVNPRRWLRDGWWRRTWKNRKLALSFARGVAPNKLATRYHSDNPSQIL